jgi:predicted homoserine dehydrogenase-like protein
MYLAQARLTDGVQVVGVADLDVGRAREALARTGWPVERVLAAATRREINDAARSGRVALTEDAAELIEAELDVVIECTGNPEVGIRHVIGALDNGRHVVNVTVEADALVGLALRRRADRAGVVYSMAYGDQPALVCEIVDWARTCGFEVVAAGKGTKHLPEYHYSTPDTVFDYYGLSADQRRTGDLNPTMFNSFLDGTKSAIEMAAIANATDLRPQPFGLRFPAVGADRLSAVLKPEAAGGVLSHSGTVEVVSCVNPDGSPVPNDLRWGVYVTFKAPTEYVRQCFAQYGVVTDDSGEYAALYRPSHLIGLELGVSVASAALRHESTGSPRHFSGDVAAVAKRDLVVGETLDGEGGYTVFGRLMPAKDSLARRALPLGLAARAKVLRAVSKDHALTYEDVELFASRQVIDLRRELEEEAQG